MTQSRRPEAEARDGSSSEEDEEGSSEENEEHEESEEEEKDKGPAPLIKKSLPVTSKKPETTQASTHRKISSSDESGSESASESDSPNPNVKPLASKPMEESLKATKKPRSKLSSVTPVAKSTKRQLESENNNNRESKRAKKRPEDADRVVAEDTAKKTGDDSKKQLFQRLWSEDDEIAILKGMIEYKAKKGADPVTEAEARDGSSSEEDEEGSSEENEEHEESEEEEKDKGPAPSIKKSLPVTSKKPETTQASTHRKISSSDESGSESASESDSPNPNVKPLASKPMEEPLKATKKPRSKLSSVTPVAKSTKRQLESENNNNRESKRAKKRPEDADRVVAEDTAKKTGDDSKKQLFQRLWSEDDEIAILKGMIEYKAKKGADPVTEMNAFHDFIKKSLHVDVSKVQLSDKVRRLRKKYENNFKKAKKGKVRSFSKVHEQEAYEWSKKIWGGEAHGGVVESTKVNGKATRSKTQKPTPKDDGPASPDRAKEGTKMAVEPNSVAPQPVQSRSSISKLGLDDDIVKAGLELISESKRVELEEKWRKFRMQEVELYLRRLDLIQEQTKLVLEALKSPGIRILVR